MSIVKRQFSNSRMKSDADLFKQAVEVVDRKRPGSGQPISTVQSPLPPRKPLFSGTQKQRLIIDVNNVEQQFPVQKLEKNSQHSSKASLNLIQNQQQLQQIKITQRQQKPPIYIDKKIINQRQEQFLSSGRPAITGESKSRNTSKQKVQSAGTNTKKFSWADVYDQQQQQQQQQRESSQNKRRVVSKEKLKALPQQPQINQIIQSYKPEQNFYDGFDDCLTKSVENKQPLCYTNFSMTSGRNDLAKALAPIQMEIKQASQEAKQNSVNSYMNAIPEQEDDGCSSLAQSTLYQFK
ncbi:unnamed protein product [Paramecium sonneborni]|uniref:Uncharacterized protein n=1 Tax=Paramecium sonneborni TaxID=65129 RepID=A0A8S1NE06_9CILI|nr:unnamed protein product [Paramecium sonneborni]